MPGQGTELYGGIHMKRTWKIGIIGACAAVVLAAGFAAAAGSQDDPLVTLGYLKNIFTPQVQTMVDEAVDANEAQNKVDFDSALANWDAKVSQAVEDAVNSPVTVNSASFTAASMAEGTAITVQAGCEVIVRSGAPVCSASLIDQTSGTVLAAGKTLSANHLYLATETCVFSIPAVENTGVVNAGPLNVRAGAGSSYEILGTLQKGAVVTIVQDGGNGWLLVTCDGLAGYVSAAYVDRNTVSTSGPVQFLIRGEYTTK